MDNKTRVLTTSIAIAKLQLTIVRLKNNSCETGKKHKGHQSSEVAERCSEEYFEM